MCTDLRNNYDAAMADAADRGVIAQVKQLEAHLRKTSATINIAPKFLRNLAAGDNYTSYYRSLDKGARHIAEREYHAHREAVDAKIHTGYREDIVNAALSLSGRGLKNYGQVALELQEVSIEDRASVLRENGYDFYERYKLGDRDATEAPGWRSTWGERELLGVAHLASKVSAATADSELVELLLASGVSRAEDRYMEVHIFGEVSWQSLSKVTLEEPLTKSEDRDDWDFGKEKLAARGVEVINLVGS